jgi:hypothetical protein
MPGSPVPRPSSLPFEHGSSFPRPRRPGAWVGGVRPGSSGPRVRRAGGARGAWTVVFWSATPRGVAGVALVGLSTPGKCRHESRRPTHPHGVEARPAQGTFRSLEPADEVPGLRQARPSTPCPPPLSRVVRCDAGPMRASARRIGGREGIGISSAEDFLGGAPPSPSWPGLAEALLRRSCWRRLPKAAYAGHPREHPPRRVRVDTRLKGGHDGCGSSATLPRAERRHPSVMAGLRPGHPCERDLAGVHVDARVKPEHDGLWFLSHIAKGREAPPLRHGRA